MRHGVHHKINGYNVGTPIIITHYTFYIYIPVSVKGMVSHGISKAMNRYCPRGKRSSGRPKKYTENSSLGP